MKTIGKPIQSIDLWVAVGTNDVRAVKGAFTDDMHILGECAYDRYKIVCTFLGNVHTIGTRSSKIVTSCPKPATAIPSRCACVQNRPQ